MKLAPLGQGPSLEQAIKNKARRLGFILAGVTTPDAPAHSSTFEDWLRQGHHGSMGYMAAVRSRLCRANPRTLMPACRSIIVLAMPYSNPHHGSRPPPSSEPPSDRGRIAAYAWGKDYHEVIPKRLRAIVEVIETRVGHPVSSRCYTDTGPVLERDLAQRAGLGWIGKNTCLINPRRGSYLLLGEILLDLELVPDPPVSSDHCGSCTRCLDACPTACILPDRTIDARRCISYLTIELRESMPVDLRPKIGGWVFGCDVCQMVCPWNRFAAAEGEPALAAAKMTDAPILAEQLQISAEEFRSRFRGSAVIRAKYEGYLRNMAVAAGNIDGWEAVPALREAAARGDALVWEHADWAIRQISARSEQDE